MWYVICMIAERKKHEGCDFSEIWSDHNGDNGGSDG